MATEYGIRESGYDDWRDWTRESALYYVKNEPDAVLIAREVSEPRIVSIRA